MKVLYRLENCEKHVLSENQRNIFTVITQHSFVLPLSLSE